MRHLEVRLIATGVELGDAKWCHVALRRRSVAPRRGVPVARQRDRRGRELLVHDAHTVCVGPDDYWARIEEIGFAEIIYFYDRGLPDALWRSELDEVVEEAPA